MEAVETVEKAKKVGNWISAILLGNTRELIARIDERTEFIVRDLKDIKPKVDDMFPKVDVLWKDRVAPSYSPRQLNERGNLILEKSGIKEIVDEKKDDLIQTVRGSNISTAYDAEETILSVMENFPTLFPDITEKLKVGAFNTGSSISDVLLVGGIYLRNLIFPELGFKIDDLDRPRT